MEKKSILSKMIFLQIGKFDQRKSAVLGLSVLILHCLAFLLITCDTTQGLPLRNVDAPEIRHPGGTKPARDDETGLHLDSGDWERDGDLAIFNTYVALFNAIWHYLTLDYSLFGS